MRCSGANRRLARRNFLGARDAPKKKDGGNKMNTTTIAVINQKGGVGKTTTCVNLAAELGAMGKKILVVDSDPQGNASDGLGYQFNDSTSLYEVMMNREEPKWSLHTTSAANVWLIAANEKLASAELELGRTADWEYRLKTVIEKLNGQFDAVIIDCPPSLGVLTVNAVAAADRILVPVQCEYYALKGLVMLAGTLQNIRLQGISEGKKIDGVLLTMYSANQNLTREVEAQIRQYYGEYMFKTVIPRNVDLAAAPGQGKTIYDYKRRSSGGKAYHQLALEVKKLWL